MGLSAQYLFISQNPAKVGSKNIFEYDKKYDSKYMQVHKLFHKQYNQYLKAFGLYDIFLIDLNGDIIYSVFKEKDFATNLLKGKYKDSGLAKVFNKAKKLKEDEIVFEDLSPYEPSYNKPASFIATPIYQDDKKIGVLAFQMPIDHINDIVQFSQEYESSGLGETGECYLVGSDYLMRTNSRFQKNMDDPLVKKVGTTIGVWEVKTKSTVDALNGTSIRGEGIIKDYRGVDVLSVYNVIDVFGTTKWVLVSEIDKEEVIEDTKSLTESLILTTILLSSVFLLIILYLIVRAFLIPLSNFENGLGDFFKFLKEEKK